MTTLPTTNAARSAILDALRRGRGPASAVLPPDLAAFSTGPFGRGAQGERIDPATLITPFENAARGWRADVLRTGVGDWPQAVRAVLDRHACRRIAIGAASPLQPGLDLALTGLSVRRFDRPIGEWKVELFGAIDAAVTGCEAGLADTGTLVLRPGAHEPRTLSLVPPVHVAVLWTSHLYASLPAAVRALAPQRAMPTNWLLVTGPSKTADIQQVLAFGAHGPKVLAIVLVDDIGMGD